MLNFIFMILMLLLSFKVWPQTANLSSSYDEYEGLNLVEALIKDQQYVQAEKYLAEVQKKERDQDQRFFLQGELYYLTAQKEIAYEKYKSVINNKNSKYFRASLIRLAQIDKSRKNWSFCLSHFSYLDSALNREELLLKATCYKGLRRWESAYEIYSNSKLKSDFEFAANRIEILLELQLFESAREEFLIYLEGSSSAIEALSLFHKFREKKVINYLSLFEGIKLKFSEDLEVLSTAVSLYYEHGWNLNMIEVLRRLATFDNKYHEYLAEALRANQSNQLAFYHQIQIPDNEKKYRSQIADYSDQKKWELILSLEKGYGRSSKKIDDGLAYTFAYSHLKYKHLDKAKLYLAEITPQQMLTKKRELSRVISLCEDDAKNCKFGRL